MTKAFVVRRVLVKGVKAIMPLEHLAEIVYKHSGLKLDKSRQKEIEQIVKEIGALSGVATMADVIVVLDQLPTSHPFWQLLLRRVTIGETYFFRHAAQFAALQEKVLPKLIQKRREANFKYLRIWSAGSATGEEIYSVAILLRELLPDIADWTLSLLGTDINQEFLEMARQGRYRTHSFRSETRSDIQERYFKLENGYFVLDSQIRQMVQFLPLNLVTGEYPSYNSRTVHQDLIICRNVTIYFDEATTRSIVKRFYTALNEGGWLMVGHAEPLASTYKDFTVQNFPDTIFYQKLNAETPQLEMKPTILAETKTAALPKQATAISKAKTQPFIKEASKPEPEVTVAMVRSIVDREDWDTAMSLLSILESHSPMDCEVHYLRGIVLMHSGKLDSARQALRRSLYCEPSYALAHYAMGEIAAQEKDFVAAQRAWLLAERAVAGMGDYVLISESDGLTTEMFRSLLALRLSYIGEQES
jgi:chemotaxis protein methyltransferase CheR